ncbi:MAG: T9SS type A sorting domain-containing protein [Bacteroidales bacterium]|nr:T9SS type A sorting domain-containing protein [Bacteroidales bacterium]
MIRYHCLILLLSAFTGLILAQGQQAGWERATPLPQENTINDIIIIPGTNKLIAVGGGSLVMKANFNDLDWELSYNPAGEPNNYPCRKAYFINESTGFITGGWQTILKTVDGGTNWHKVYSGETIYNWQYINDIDFISASTGFAIASDGLILKTDNTGESWDTIASGVSFDLNVLAFSDAAKGYIFSGGTEYLKTTDGGQTWTTESLLPPLQGLTIKNVFFTAPSTALAIGVKYSAGSDKGYIYKTVDSGNSWYEVFSDNNGWYWPEAIDFYDENRGIASFNTIMYGCINYFTTDGGETWNESPMVGCSWCPARTVCCFGQDAALVAGNMGMILLSEDMGASWDFISSRDFNGDIFRFEAVDQGSIYALSVDETGGVTGYDLMKSADGGNNWNKIFSSSGYCSFDFINATTGYFAEHFIDLFIYKTENGGNGWTEISSVPVDIEPLICRFYDEEYGLICGEGILAKTEDGGLSWQEIYIPFAFNLYDLEYSDENTVFLCGDASLFVSHDAGLSWDSVASFGNNDIHDLFFLDQDTFFLAAENAIFKSADGGNLWYATLINYSGHMVFKSVFFPSDSVGYAVGDGGFANGFKSTDGGETWNVMETNCSSGLTAVHFFDDMNGIAAGNRGVVLKTSSGGLTGDKTPELLQMHSDFQVFSNPCHDVVHVRYKSKRNRENNLIIIFDRIGSQVKKISLRSNENEAVISIRDLKPGIYFIQMRTGNGKRETVKVVKL